MIAVWKATVDCFYLTLEGYHMPIFHQIQTLPVSDVYLYSRLGRRFHISSFDQILIDLFSNRQTDNWSEVVTLDSLDSLDSLESGFQEKLPSVRTVAFKLHPNGSERIIRLSFDTSNPQKWCAAVENDNHTISFIYLDTTSIDFEDHGKEYLSQFGHDDTYKKVIEFIITQDQVDESKLQMLQNLVGDSSEIDIEASTQVINEAIGRYELLTQLVKINPLIYPSRYYNGYDWNKFISKQKKQLKNDLEDYKKQLVLDSKNEKNWLFNQKIVTLESNVAAMNRYIDLIKQLSTAKINDWFAVALNTTQPEYSPIAKDIMAAVETISCILLNESLLNEYSVLFRVMASNIESIQTADSLLNKMIGIQNILILEQNHLRSVMRLAAFRLVIFGIIAGLMASLFKVSFFALTGKGLWAGVSFELLVAVITASAAVGSLSGMFAIIAIVELLTNAIKSYKNASRVYPLEQWDDLSDLTSSRKLAVETLNETVKQIQEKNNQLLSVSSNRFGFHFDSTPNQPNSICNQEMPTTLVNTG